MSGLGLMIAFVIAIIVMIVAISKYKIHPFLSIMTVSLVLGLVAGIPLVDTKVDGKTVQGIATVIGSGFSGFCRIISHCSCFRICCKICGII